MRIVSYNINGLNAFYNRNGVSDLITNLNPDVICFQETKKQCDQLNWYLDEFTDYKFFSCSNNWKRGYAGVCTLVKNHIADKLLSVQTPQLTGGYAEGRIVTLEFPGFYLINVYTLNSGDKDEERIEWDDLFFKYIANLQKFKPVIILGDLNVVHTDLDYWGNRKAVIDTMPGLKQYENDNFSKLLTELDLVDTFRYKYPNLRLYSWYSYRGGARAQNKGWRLDYALISRSRLEHVKESLVLSTYEGSDHCPILLDL